MAAVPVQQVGDDPTLFATQTPDSPSRWGKDYYLHEGMEEMEYREYCGPNEFTQAIESQADQLRLDKTGQYVVFSGVTQQDLMTIDRLRNTNYKGLRFMYLNEDQVLIVKIMPGILHEASHQVLARMIIRKVIAMGLEDDEFFGIGATRLQGVASQKEADSAFKPLTLRPLSTHWPTLVIECGVSESLKRLRVDGNWWLENSEGEVQIILLISVNKKGRRIILEQWEMVPVQYPATRANPIPPATRPKRTRLVNIVGPFVPAPTTAAAAQAPIMPAPAAPAPVLAPVIPPSVPAPAVPAPVQALVIPIPASSAQVLAPVVIAPVLAPVQAPVIPLPTGSAQVPATVIPPPAPPAPVVVTGAPLTFDFSKIFLRPPVPSQGESDIIFTSKDLEDYARNVWRAIK